MSVAATQTATALERRRSQRFPLALPLTVRGASLDGKLFSEDTFTLSVSTHGALVMLATTVTLGQKLHLRNPQTQGETEAWVTRFGLPRGGMAHAGIEFVQAATEFWSDGAGTKASIPGPDLLASESLASAQRSDHQIYVLPQPESSALPVPDLIVSDEASTRAIVAASSAESSPALVPPDALLRLLEQTLQQAAERVVTATATARLGTAVRHATAAIEDFTNARIADIEDRLSQARRNLVSSAHDEFRSRSREHMAQTEEYLQKRAAELLEQSAYRAHDAFADKLSETAKIAVAQFAAQHLARLSEHVQAAIGEIREETGAVRSILSELQEKARGEMERASTDASEKAELLATRNDEVQRDWEDRLREFRDELSRDKDQQVEEFVQRLRGILTNMLASLD